MKRNSVPILVTIVIGFVLLWIHFSGDCFKYESVTNYHCPNIDGQYIGQQHRQYGSNIKLSINKEQEYVCCGYNFINSNKTYCVPASKVTGSVLRCNNNSELLLLLLCSSVFCGLFISMYIGSFFSDRNRRSTESEQMTIVIGSLCGAIFLIALFVNAFEQYAIHFYSCKN